MRLALAVLAHNRGPAVALLAGPNPPRLRRKLFTVPARLVYTRPPRLHLRGPAGWPL